MLSVNKRECLRWLKVKIEALQGVSHQEITSTETHLVGEHSVDHTLIIHNSSIKLNMFTFRIKKLN